MKKIIDFKDNRGVMSLIVILGIGFFVLAIALTLTGQIVVEIMRNRNTIAGDQSFFTAEAAAREGFYQYLATTSYTGGNPELLNDVSEGSISVTTSTLGVAHREVIGTAKNNLTNRKVIYTVVFLEGLAFEYALFSESDLYLGGNAKVGGNTFSNGTTSVNSNAVTMNGDVTSAGNITAGNTGQFWNRISGATTTNADPISAPQITIDFDEYKNAADSNGTLFTAKADFESYLDGNASASGVIFASTTESINLSHPDTDLSGSVVTLDDLQIVDGKFSSPDDRATIVVAGDFTMTGGEIEGNVYVEGDFRMNVGKIEGIVYVKGGTTFGAGNWTIEGAIISLGGVTLIGCGGNGVIYNPDILANWFDFITITNPPEIKSWQQE